jgi:hypothetical protein
MRSQCLVKKVGIFGFRLSKKIHIFVTHVEFLIFRSFLLHLGNGRNLETQLAMVLNPNDSHIS